jgi:hypothetical protein
MGMKIGGTLGKATEAVKKKANITPEKAKNAAIDIMLPTARAQQDVLTGKSSVGQGMVDAMQDLYAPGSRATIGSITKGPVDGPKAPKANPAASDPALDQKNIWQGMRDSATKDYRSASTGYNPYMTNAGPELSAMNYNPYRSAGMNQAASQAGSQYQSLMSNLQNSGGVTASDRMNAMQNFNRQKITGQLGAGAGFDQKQAGANFDAGSFNAGRAFDVNRANAGAANDAAQFGAQQQQRRYENLYNSGIADRNLGRQLDASQIIANQQMRGGKPGIFDGLFRPIDNAINAWR